MFQAWVCEQPAMRSSPVPDAERAQGAHAGYASEQELSHP
jgi:hypothetical protein